MVSLRENHPMVKSRKQKPLQKTNAAPRQWFCGIVWFSGTSGCWETLAKAESESFSLHDWWTTLEPQQLKTVFFCWWSKISPGFAVWKLGLSLGKATKKVESGLIQQTTYLKTCVVRNVYHHYVGMIISYYIIIWHLSWFDTSYHDLFHPCFTHFSRENLAVHHALQCWWRSNRAAADLFERWRMYAKRQPFHSGPEGTLGFILDLWYENCGRGKNNLQSVGFWCENRWDYYWGKKQVSFLENVNYFWCVILCFKIHMSWQSLDASIFFDERRLKTLIWMILTSNKLKTGGRKVIELV